MVPSSQRRESQLASIPLRRASARRVLHLTQCIVVALLAILISAPTALANPPQQRRAIRDRLRSATADFAITASTISERRNPLTKVRTALARRRTRRAVEQLPPAARADGEAVLERTTGSVPRAGNRIELLFEGAPSFERRWADIRAAQSSINYQVFIFQSDSTGWQTARELAAAARRGVKVRVLYDAVGSFRADPRLFAFMRSAGVEVRVIRPVGNVLRIHQINNRAHEKLVVIDGRIVHQGSTNTCDQDGFGGTGYAVPALGERTGNYDVDARIEGPVAADHQRMFLRNWASHGPRIPSAEENVLFPALAPFHNGVTITALHHRPVEDGDTHIDDRLRFRLLNAQREITIHAAYMIPSAEIIEILNQRRTDGVRVRVLVSGAEVNDHRTAAWLADDVLAQLAEAGMEIYVTTDRMVHSKVVTIDEQYAFVGSYNMNPRSRHRDSELMAEIEDGNAARQLNARLDEIIAFAGTRRYSATRVGRIMRTARDVVRGIAGNSH